MGSILKPEASVMVGVSTAALVGFVYQFGLPSGAMIGATTPQDPHISSARRKAAWTSAALVGALSLMTRDKTVFVIGGATLVALDWHARVANAASPDTGKLITSTGYTPVEQAVPVAEQAGSGYEM